MTWPARSRPASSGSNRVISLVLPSTSRWDSTAPARWPATASRCTACPSAAQCRVPRSDFPSTATARRLPGPATWLAVLAVSHEPTAASSASASTASSTRRMAASPGGSNRPVSGSRRIPSTAITCGGASAAHSLIAANDRAPATTAATDVRKRDASECRTPRGRRGSGTAARQRARPGSGRETGSRTASIRDNDRAGTAIRIDHGT
jgi:hypothetical protein